MPAIANCPLGDLTLSKLTLHPHPDAMCYVALLARIFPFVFQNPIDKLNRRF
jgi:hypothetical protein